MFVLPLAGAAPNPVASAVTISGGSISAVGVGLTVAKLWIIADGTIWKETAQGGTIQIAVATDWIIPNTDADSSYELRYTNFVFTVGDPVTAGVQHFNAFAEEDEWVDMSVSRQISVFTADDEEDKEVTFDLQIRKDGGAVLATGSYTLAADRITS